MVGYTDALKLVLVDIAQFKLLLCNHLYEEMTAKSFSCFYTIGIFEIIGN